ncbi:helix-turn-helix transcriptional regulator [Croceicoccus ponticola]|nr:LuxR C-terminal-related transcriptional regulator [Croceicoccus ponticola]
MGDQIRRDGLLQRLDGAMNHRLTLIHAPAGYGKTSLLAQWRARMEQGGQKVTWLTLERDDCDLKQMVRYLLAAIAPVGGQTGARKQGTASDMPPRAALSAIVNWLAQDGKPSIVILDDLHRATNRDVCEYLQSLIRLAPPHAHFVVASRDYPWLGQTMLAAENQLLELGAQDLRFSLDEAKVLLGRNGHTPEGHDLEAILSRTEGWAMALQLASLMMGSDRRAVEQFRGSRADLARYLSEQVLMALPDEWRDIVLRTALVERLTGDVVDLLCQRRDGWIVLEQLEQQGIFLTAIDADRRAYRYHQLFAEYLRDRFERMAPDTCADLHGQLARWFADKDDTVEAVDHAIKSGQYELLGDIVDRAGGWRMIPLGAQGLLERAILAMPRAVIEARPTIALAEVYLLMKKGDLGTARKAFDKVVAAAAPALANAEVMTEIRVVGDTLSDYANEPVTFDDLLEREALLRKLPADDHLVIANISETLGAKFFEGGWLERALQPILSAGEHYHAIGALYSEVFTRFLEARIKRAQGRQREAAIILENAAADIAGNFGNRSDLAANCAAFRAELLYEEDRVTEAQDLLGWSLDHMERSDAWVDVYAAAYVTMAHILSGHGRYDEARDVMERARRVAARRGLDQLSMLIDICEFDLNLVHGGSLDEIVVTAECIGLDRLADWMCEQSPRYRPVAIAAMLARIRLRLLTSQFDAAAVDIETMRRWARERGAGRLLVDVDLLSAYCLHRTGCFEESRDAFSEAVGIAMFQDLRRPFVDLRTFVQPCLDDLIKREPQMDRTRAQFVKMIIRSVANSRNTVTMQGIFSEAEAEVLNYLSQGHSNKEIARLIGMSPDTVKYRLKAVFKKLGVSKRRDAVRMSAERGFLNGVAGLPATTDRMREADLLD